MKTSILYRKLHQVVRLVGVCWLLKALSAGSETCVLVFDEIDTGISGLSADVVGRKMYEISNDFQTLCISHLPPGSLLIQMLTL